MKITNEKEIVFTISPFVTDWLQKQEIKPNRAQRRAAPRKKGRKRQPLSGRDSSASRYF